MIKTRHKPYGQLRGAGLTSKSLWSDKSLASVPDKRPASTFTKLMTHCRSAHRSLHPDKRCQACKELCGAGW